MRGSGRTILAAAIAFAIGIGPISLFALIQASPSGWQVTLKDFQGLAGSLTTLFAAGVAAIGVWLNIEAQRANTEAQRANTQAQIRAQGEAAQRQIKAQFDALQTQLATEDKRRAEDQLQARQAEDRDRREHCRRIAAAIEGEITAMMEVLRWESKREAIERAVTRMKETGIPQFVGMKIESDHTVIFRATASHIGALPAPLPQGVAYFYGLYAGLLERLKAMTGIDNPMYDPEKCDLDTLVIVAQTLAEDIKHFESVAKNVASKLLNATR